MRGSVATHLNLVSTKIESLIKQVRQHRLPSGEQLLIRIGKRLTRQMFCDVRKEIRKQPHMRY